MPAYLNPLGEGRPIVMDKPILFVGRHPECDIILLNSRKVSRKHGCIALVNDQFLIRDLGSTNGIAVNGQRVRKEAHVALGDQITFGDVNYQLLSGEIPAGAKIASHRDDHPDDSPIDPVSLSKLKPPPHNVEYTELSQEFPVAIPEDEGPRVPLADSPGAAAVEEKPAAPSPRPIPRPHNFDDESGPDVMIIDESKYFFEDDEDDHV
jgi:hypothetical protein